MSSETIVAPESVPAPILKSDREAGKGFRGFFSRIARGLRNVFGFVTMVIGVALVSAIPVLNFLSLGYLLEASARVARGGKMRHGFVGMEKFAQIGGAFLGIWLWTLPLRLVHNLWRDAELIRAGSEQADQLRIFLSVLVILVSLHLVWALLRGGKLRHFFWPAPIRLIKWLGDENRWKEIRYSVASFCEPIRPVHYWLLGFYGFCGAAIWLVIPVGILILASGVSNPGVSFLIALVGGILLGIAVLFLPFLQTRYALTRRFREFFSISEARALFRRAPLAFWLALFATLLFALPLYLLKIELTPREVAWLPNLVFVLFIFPARLLVGWAISRALRQESNRIWVSRWFARLASLPVVAGYVLLVWLTQYLSWHGSLSLFEQHAFMVPAPLLGL